MPWTHEDEAEFQRKKRLWFAEEERKDAEQRSLAAEGLAPRCPHCGSHRYSETTLTEVCDDCGLSVDYRG